MKKPAAPLPSNMPIPFDVIPATFIQVDDHKVHFSKQSKGVMDMLRLNAPRQNANGDVRWRFLRTSTYATHSDLLRAAGIEIGEQPTAAVNWQNDRYKVAARYTARPSSRGPLEIGIMLGSTEQGKPVEDMRSYADLRQAVAVTCGFVVAQRELRRDVSLASYTVVIINNYLSPEHRNIQELSANNISQLTNKLAPR